MILMRKIGKGTEGFLCSAREKQTGKAKEVDLREK